jgi:hypothetical protein
MPILYLASLTNELFGNSVMSRLNRHKALSVSPFERRISPSLKRRVSSGWGWAKERFCIKNKKRRARIKFQPLFL